MNISIVIPNYNGADLLQENIPLVVKALLAYKGGKRELIVVDDASIDTSINQLAELVKQYDSEDFTFTVLKNPVNLGFSGTVNRGVAKAVGEIVVLLNSDVKPYDDFLFSLVPHFTNTGVFAVGCADESLEGEKVVVRGRGIGSWKRGLLLHKKGTNNKKNTLWVSGGSGAFRKDLWEKLGGLNTIYAPFYWEDIDLSYRALKAGYTVLFEPESRVIHEHQKGAILTGFKAKKIKIISYRNQFLFSWINISDRTLLLQHIIWLPIHVVSALKRRDLAFIQGFCDASLKIGEVREMRKKVQRQVCKSDRDVIRLFLS